MRLAVHGAATFLVPPRARTSPCHSPRAPSRLPPMLRWMPGTWHFSTGTSPRHFSTESAQDPRYSFSMSIVLNWNGEDLPDDVRQRMPAELRGLPRGRYVLEPVDEAPVLTDEDEAGIAAAIESVRQGKAVSMEAARARIDRILGR